MKAKSKVLFASLALLLLAPLVMAAPAAVPAVPFLPGIMVSDAFPKGCVDCHTYEGEGKDYRLSKAVSDLPNHPNFTNAFKNSVIPEACLLCHKAGSKLGSFTEIIHKVHYQGKAKSQFITVYQGACLHCHSMNPTTGAMSVKTGPANW